MDPTMYSVLGATAGAANDELDAAYKARAAELDREEVHSTTDAARASVRDARDRLEEAWEILGDPKLRLQYDLKVALLEPRTPDSVAPEALPLSAAGTLHHDLPSPPAIDVDAPPMYHHLPLPPPPAPVGRPLRSDECQLCASSPAARITLRRETGMVILRHRRRLDGRYCRSCGLSLFREMMDKTLVAGWWAPISFFVNWYTIGRNLGARITIGRLEEPVPNRGTRAPMVEPLDSGPPLYRRVGPWVAAAVAAAFVALLAVG